MRPTTWKPGNTVLIRAFFLLVSCIIVVTTCVKTLSRKEAFYLDEYSSYSCANGTTQKNISLSNGRAYTGEEVRKKVRRTYGVAESNRFHYGAVWKSLSHNVHPPVFYAALHTVCSFTPGAFSLWQAAGVNILFGLISLVFLQKILRAFVKSEWLAGFMLVCFACLQGVHANIVFLRDYAACACGTLMAVWGSIRYLRGNRKATDLEKMALAFAFGVLSHYYCAIYLCFLCGTLCAILMARKDWKGVAGVFLSAAVSAAVAVAVFPAMIVRIFYSKRGLEAANNLTETGNAGWLKKIASFYDGVNGSFFGGLLTWLALLVALLIVVAILIHKKGKGIPSAERGATVTVAECLLLLVPSVLYFLLVSRIAPYKAPRYMYPATAIMSLSMTALLCHVLSRIMRPRGLLLAMTAAMFVMSCRSWRTGEFGYLYEGNRQKVSDALEAHKGIDAVQIWDTTMSFSSVLTPQYGYFGSLTSFYKADREMLAQIEALVEGKDVMVLIGSSERNEVLETLKRDYPEYEVEELGNVDGQKRFWNYYFRKKASHG